MARGKIAKVTLGVAAGMLATAAAPASGDTTLGTTGGITYVEDTVAPDPPALAVLEAACPAGTQASGGGFDADVTGFLNDLAPADGPDADGDLDDAWFASVNYGPSGYDPTAHVYVICEERGHAERTETAPVPAGESETLSVDCPGPRKPTGGGVGLSGTASEAYVNSSYPFDGPDGDREPDDGWRGRAYNETGMTKTLSVTAVCRGGEFRNRFRFWDVPTDEFTYSPCVGSEHLVGSGWRLTGAASESRPAYAVPGDASDPNSVPDDAAEFFAYGAGAPDRLVPHAICAA